MGWPVTHARTSLDLLEAGVASAAKRARHTDSALISKDPHLAAKFEAALATLAHLELPYAELELPTLNVMLINTGIMIRINYL